MPGAQTGFGAGAVATTTSRQAKQADRHRFDDQNGCEHEQPADVPARGVPQPSHHRRPGRPAKIPDRIDEADPGRGAGAAKKQWWYRPEDAQDRPLPHLRQRKTQDEEPDVVL